MDQHDKYNAFKLKIADTQNIIRNKFTKACANRLECERSTNQAMQQQTSAKIYSNKSRKIETNDPNYLCTRLRVLLTIPNMDEVQHAAEVNAIISHLHASGILL